MPLHLTHDVAFEAPEPYVDETLHELNAPLDDEGLLAVLVRRAPLPPDAGLFQVVEAHVKREARSLPLHQVLAVSERVVAGRPAVEVVSVWKYGQREILGREIHLAHRGTRLTFSTTTVAAYREVSDAYFEQMIATLQLAPGEGSP
jgi:hypothetical protein